MKSNFELRLDNCISGLNDIKGNISKHSKVNALKLLGFNVEMMLQEVVKEIELEEASIKLSREEKLKINSKIKILREMDIDEASFKINFDTMRVYVRFGLSIRISLYENFKNYDKYYYSDGLMVFCCHIKAESE